MKLDNKIMTLIKALKLKTKRAKEKLKDIEVLIDEKQASSRQQQDYLALKSKVEAWEDAIDLAESMIED